MTDDNNLVRRLREPAFGTETTERNLMGSAADHIEELEAKLAKAVEALERVSNSQPRPKRNGDYDRSDVSTLQRIARTALAELTGVQKDGY